METPTGQINAQGRDSDLATGGLVLLRRQEIDFRRVAAESGLTRGKLAHSPHFGWGVQNSYGDPGPDFGCITPPAFEPGETELRIDCSQWHFYGPAAPAHQQENTEIRDARSAFSGSTG